MTRKPDTCLLCGELINHKPKTEWPEGTTSGFWQGWYHLDSSKEHFNPVGWYDLTIADTFK